MNYQIRKTQVSDGENIWLAHQRSIKEICSPDYTEEQVNAWSNFQYKKEHYENVTTNGDYHFVLEVANKVEGFLHFGIKEDKIVIFGLYFSPEVKGKGFGRKIFSKAFEVAKENNIKEMALHSTKTSCGFYQAIGFKIIREDSCSIRGTEIPGLEMRMTLE